MVFVVVCLWPVAGIAGWVMVVLTIIAVVLVVASIVSFILWCIFCASTGTMCTPLLWMVAVLTLLVPVALGVGGLLVAFGLTTCGFGAFLDAGYLSILSSIAYFAARCTGCLLAPDGSVRCFL
jgi:hypothetical protein